MNSVDKLRHLKHRGSHAIGRMCLAIAARNPRPRILQAMRSRLGIQLNLDEISLVSDVIVEKRPANLLVFGTGKDSEYWWKLNRGGRTLFLEDDVAWIERAARVVPYLSIQPITYNTVLRFWRDLLESEDGLADGLPESVAETDWDVILVDAPQGWLETDPGRMKSIYFASRLAKSNTDVFVHDCNRQVERAYCDRFFSAGTLRRESGRLRQYRESTTSNE